MKDSWCATVIAKSGAIVSGGAARNVRIAEFGGMDKIIKYVASRAAKDTIRIANQVVTENRRKAELIPKNLQKVKNAQQETLH